MSIPFRPIYGPEDLIKNQEITTGHLYIAIDSGKIFLDTEDERIMIGGGGAALLYSSVDSLKVNTDGSYTIKQTELDDSNSIPKRFDLIINSDGRFFRVNYYDSQTQSANCKLIAVSGSGGGSSGGDSSEDPTIIKVTYLTTEYTFLEGQDYLFSFVPESSVDKNLNVTYQIENNLGQYVDTGSLTVSSGKQVDIPAGRKIVESGGKHAIHLTIEGLNSKTYTRSVTNISCVSLRIENDYTNFQNYQIYTGTVQYSVKVFGRINKTLTVEIDGSIRLDPILLDATYNDRSKAITIDCQSLGLSPGVHTIRAWLTANGVDSDIVQTDFIYHPIGVPAATYVIVTDYPQSVLSYEVPAVTYWVYNTANPEGSTNKITLYLNGVNVEEVEYAQYQNESGKIIWNVNNLIPGEINTCEIQSGGTSRSIDINCIKSNIFDEIVDTNLLLLNANGRSNGTSLERRLMWSHTNSFNETIEAELKNFNWYNNGWMIDTAGRNCLRISNGASVDIPIKVFKNESPSNGGFTFEFEFKPYNLYFYNLLTQSTETVDTGDEDDDTVEIIRTFNSDLAAISYIQGTGADAYGFCLGTQDAYFRMSDGKNSTVRYTDGEIVNVAVTVNASKGQICMYVNGEMSGMTSYSNSTSKLPIYANKINLNSNQCDLDLYSIRIYNRALSSNEIVQNYVASKKDLLIYNQNSFSTNNEVSLVDLKVYNQENPDNATIPYMIIKTKAPDILPFNKGNADVICDIEFINPGLDRALELGRLGNTPEESEEYYLTHAPSFLAKNVSLNVQGTSSQKYPRKNFKGKMLNKKVSDTSLTCINETIPEEKRSMSKLYLDSDIAEKTFTWKADYMDSSGRHNTGFASYVQELYWNHPLDYYEGTAVSVGDAKLGKYRQKYRTSLFGFPVLVFHEKSDGSNPEFIGRYNFNLDKGADDTLGMAVDEAHPIISGKTYEQVCECWEMANNLGGRCSFRGNPFDYGYNYDYNNGEGRYETVDNEGKVIESSSDLGDDLEVRYHINGDLIEGALENLAEDGETPIKSSEAFKILLGDGTSGGAYSHLQKFFNWLQGCYFAFDLNTQEDQEMVQTLLNRVGQTILETDEDYINLKSIRKEKFESEFNKHLNLEYCLVYYIMTELFVQYDSRGKNMMFASWGPMEFQKDSDGNDILDEDGNKVPGDYIWFPIYYDIDTQLGVNNSGVPSWEYNVEPSSGFNSPSGKKIFSTANSLLWNNIHELWGGSKGLVEQRYRLLRGHTLTIPKMNGYYNFDFDISGHYAMKGILPINIINADQNYKYILPSLSRQENGGYINGIDTTGKPTYRHTSAYFYCLQGTRDLHRAQFLRNRFNYYDSKWMAGEYTPGTTEGAQRWRANKANNVKEDLATKLVLKVKPSLDQYLVVWLDESDTYVYPFYAKGGEVTEIDLTKFLPSSEFQQQLVYIGGPDHIQEYGNVSLFYLDEFEFPSINTVKIELGNEDLDYDNLEIDVSKFTEATTNKPLLKVFDVTNLSKLNASLDFSSTKDGVLNAVKLEEFKALGTNLTKVSFADGANLKKVYLPKTINELELKHLSNLNKIVYEKEDIEEIQEDGTVTNSAEVLFIEDLISNGTTNLNTINIIGPGLGLYSYNLLDKLVDVKVDEINGGNSSAGLSVNLEEVNWTPYTQLGEGAIYEADKDQNYKYATNYFSFNDYTYNASTWNEDLINGRIYYLNDSELNPVNNLDLLNTLIQDKHNHFTNITDTEIKSYPTITGDLYINNDASAPISEADIANEYSKYFPSLNIKAAVIDQAYRARFIRIDNGAEKEIYTQRVSKDADWDDRKIILPDPQIISAPSHYEFAGWSQVKPEGDFEKDQKNIIQNDDIKTFILDEDSIYDENNHNLIQGPEFLFYAVYKKVSYKVIFSDPTAKDVLDRYNEEIFIEYGSDLKEPAQVPSRSVEESKLELTSRLAFKGWTNKEAEAGIVNGFNLDSILVDVSSYTADRNYNFYAVYVKENVYDYPTDSKYFKSDREYGDGTYILDLNENYLISGKVTLPKEHDGKIISAIGNFKNALGATGIFFEEGSSYKEVSAEAFYNTGWSANNQKLIGVYLPDTIETIGNDAFRGISSLEHLSDQVIKGNQGQLSSSLKKIGSHAFAGTLTVPGNYHLYKLPETLVSLGESAFEFGGPNIRFTSLPKGLSTIPNSAFKFLRNLNITEFGSKNSDGIENALEHIGQYAFQGYYDGNGVNKTIESIKIYSSVQRIDINAFKDYGITWESDEPDLVGYKTYSNVEVFAPESAPWRGNGDISITKNIGFYKPVQSWDENIIL